MWPSNTLRYFVSTCSLSASMQELILGDFGRLSHAVSDAALRSKYINDNNIFSEGLKADTVCVSTSRASLTGQLVFLRQPCQVINRPSSI